jgi:hypothetical protein
MLAEAANLCARRSQGMHKGAAALLWGEPTHRCVPALFCRPRSVPSAWGEPARPGFPPEGETGKGAIKFPCCRRLVCLATLRSTSVIQGKKGSSKRERNRWFRSLLACPACYCFAGFLALQSDL